MARLDTNNDCAPQRNNPLNVDLEREIEKHKRNHQRLIRASVELLGLVSMGCACQCEDDGVSSCVVCIALNELRIAIEKNT